MAGAAAEELSQNIRDQFLSCKICLDGLKDPKTLPCLHTFCADCLHYYVDHNRIDNRKFACPICRRNIYIPKNGVDGFPDSFFVTSLTDMVESQQTGGDRKCGICKFKDGSIEAKLMCAECKIELCTECGGKHNEAKITSGHTLLPLSSPVNHGRENYCRMHRGETIKFYCETCNSPICLPCTFLDHAGHQVEEIKHVRQSFTQDMTNMVLQSKDNIMQLQQTKEDLIELETELFLRKETVRSEIYAHVQEVIREVKDQETELVAKLEEFYDVRTLHQDIKTVESTIFNLHAAHDFAEQLLADETSPITQIVNRTQAKANLQRALTYEIPDVTIHHTKLDQYSQYLFGHSDIHLGTLLKCNEKSKYNLITEFRPVLPSCKAVYLQSLRLPNHSPMGDVLALAFIPSTHDLVILCTGENKIRIFNRRGLFKFEFGDESVLAQPSDIAITREGDIAVADIAHCGIKVFDPYGTLQLQFGDSEMFEVPIALDIDTLGKFVTCDQGRKVISINRPNGELVAQIPIAEIPTPHDIRIAGNKLYVSDNENHIIALYSYGDELQFKAKLSTRRYTEAEDSDTDSMPIAGARGVTFAGPSPAVRQRSIDTRPPTSGPSTAAPSTPEGAKDSDAADGFLDISGLCIGNSGELIVADATLNRLHLFNSRSELSSIKASGKPLLRPNSIAISTDNLLAVSHQGVEDLDGNGFLNEVCVYRLLRADI